MKRIILVAIISGIISSLIACILFFYVLQDAWLFFIIPAIMGICIQKFGNISSEEVDMDAAKEKKVKYLCIGLVLFFTLLTAIPLILISIHRGSGWDILIDIPFYVICGIDVWFFIKFLK